MPPVRRTDSGSSSGVSKDEKGNLIDPPTITSFEQEITAAANAADVDQLQEVQERYDKERVKLAERRAKRESNNNDG